MIDACSICFEETDDNNPLVNLHDFSTSHPEDRKMAMHRGLNDRKHFACETCFNEMNRRGQSCPLCRAEMGNPNYIQYKSKADPSLHQRRGKPKKATLSTGFSPDLKEINKKWKASEGTWMAPIGKMLKTCTGSDCGIKGGRKKRKKKTRKRRCSKKRLKKKMICHKGTKKKLKKLRKLTKKLKVKLTKCSKKRLKKWKGGKRCKKTRRKRRGGNNEKAKEYWGKPIKERWRENPLLIVSPNAQRINWVYRTMKDGIPL
tara:strand:- start:1239 stop:2015 length:777 start_codon:yes stop_codon:yes gene_type:complete